MSQRLVFLLHRREGVSREAFQARWREGHAPLVAERAAVLGIRRYQQVHTVGGPRREGTVPEPDGSAELWFDGPPPEGEAEARRRAAEELLADEREFIDLARSPIWLADEVLLRDGSDEGLRLSAALRRRDGMTRQAFRHHWQHVHGPFALAHPEVFGFRRYVQLQTPDDAEAFPPAQVRGGPPPFDGLSEIWLDEVDPDPEHARRVREEVLEDEARFVDWGASPLWLGQVHVIVDRSAGVAAAG